ncbi:MAG: acetylpolyamine aminohydrolase [Planctomycetes bacterium]|nr:acetylpolyamine aminohydrolase [Planctomycetota bacterium]
MDLSDGLPPRDHPDSPARVDLVLEGFARSGPVEVTRVHDLAEEDVRSLHDADYVDFLLEASGALAPGEELLPVSFGKNLSRAPWRLRPGMFAREVGTPILAGTPDAALNSAAAAAAAARWSSREGHSALALCRPPGHHAGRRRYGGYSYFNNATLAARILASSGRTAILDIDYHLGEGSAELAVPEIPYFSLHADPWANYPYLEAGRTFPENSCTLATVQAGAGVGTYMALLESLGQGIRDLAPAFLVVSLGFDTFRGDDIQDEPIAIETDDFARIGAAVARLPGAKLLVLEGGYDRASLVACAENFARGFIG